MRSTSYQPVTKRGFGRAVVQDVVFANGPTAQIDLTAQRHINSKHVHLCGHKTIYSRLFCNICLRLQHLSEAALPTQLAQTVHAHAFR